MTLSGYTCLGKNSFEQLACYMNLPIGDGDVQSHAMLSCISMLTSMIRTITQTTLLKLPKPT